MRNLVTNGTFESVTPSSTTEKFANGDLESWLNPTYLNNWDSAVSDGNTLTQETSTPHGGAKAAKLYFGSENSGDYNFIYQTIELLADTKYKLSFWYKYSYNDPTPIRIGDFRTSDNIHFLKVDDNTWSTDFQYLVAVPTTTWTKYEVEFTTLADHTSYTTYPFGAVAPYYLGGIPTGESLYFDDFSLTQIQEPDGWSVANSPEIFEASTDKTHGGTYSARIVDSTGSYGAFYKEISVVTGSYYQLSFWYFLVSGSLHAGIGTGNISDSFSKEYTTTGAWTKVELCGTAIATHYLYFMNQSNSVAAEFHIAGVHVNPLYFGRNIIINGDFESEPVELTTNGGMELGDPPTGWTAFGTPDSFERSDDNVRSGGGSYNMHIVTSGGWKGAQQNVASLLSSGQTYKLSFWYYIEPDGRIQIGLYNGGAWAPVGSEILTTTGVWTYKELEFVVPDAANQQILFCDNNIATDFRIDDVSLTLVAPAGYYAWTGGGSWPDICNVNDDLDYVHGGSKSAHIKNVSASYGGVIKINLGMQKGKSYLVSFWYYNVLGQMVANNKWDWGMTTQNVQGEWLNTKRLVTPTIETGEVLFFMGDNTTENQEFYIDDFTVREGTASPRNPLPTFRSTQSLT